MLISLVEGDRSLESERRMAHADPGDASALYRTARALTRSGQPRRAAEAARQAAQVRANETRRQRSVLRRKALKSRIGAARTASKRETGYPTDSPAELAVRKARRHAQPYVDGHESAWRNDPNGEAVDKLAKQVRAVARKHEVEIGELYPADRDAHSRGSHEDAERLSHLHGSHGGQHWSTDEDDPNTDHWSTGTAHFKTRNAAELYAQDLGNRHHDRGVETSISRHKRSGDHVVDYGIGHRGDTDNWVNR